MASVQAAHATVLRQTREPQRAQSSSRGAGSKAGIDSRAPEAPPGPAVSGLVRLAGSSQPETPRNRFFVDRRFLSSCRLLCLGRGCAPEQPPSSWSRALSRARTSAYSARCSPTAVSDGKTSCGLESAMLSLCFEVLSLLLAS